MANVKTDGKKKVSKAKKAEAIKTANMQKLAKTKTDHKNSDPLDIVY